MSALLSPLPSPLSPQVIIVGSYVQDQAWFVERFPRPGETVRASRYNTGPGGKRFAEGENMPCRWQIHDTQPTSTSSITVNAKAENQISMIFGANEHLDPAYVRAQEDLFRGAKTLLIQLENNLGALQA